MAKLLLFFGGTGETKETTDINRLVLADDVICIHFKGCQSLDMGNGTYFPNLDIGARNIRKAFNASGFIDIEQLHTDMDEAIISMEFHECTIDKPVAIDSIALVGFSRGAVSCFACARFLNDLDIPIHIIANQPVPGNFWLTKHLPYTEFYKNFNLQDYHNIRSCKILIAAYGTTQSFFRNAFFWQMVPCLPSCSFNEVIRLPFNHHLAGFVGENQNLLVGYIGLGLAEIGFSNKPIECYMKDIMCYYLEPMSYSFLPSIMTRAVANGSELPIGFDELYKHSITEYIDDLLVDNLLDDEVAALINDPSNLSFQQKRALIELYSSCQQLLGSYQTKEFIPFYAFILSDNPHVERFCALLIIMLTGSQQILKKMRLSSHTFARTLNKNQALMEKLPIFQMNIILSLFKCFQSPSPEAHLPIIIDEIKSHHQTFIDGVASHHRAPWTPYLAVILNLLTLIISLPVRYFTGDWLFSLKPHSQRATEALSDALEHELNVLSLSSQQVFG